MEQFKAEHLSFFYPNETVPMLQDITFEIEKGDFIVLCGASGSGKSTLLRQLKTALTPSGKQIGKIYFKGQCLEKVSQRSQASQIGYVLQSPEQQIVTDKVWHELAFGLESLGYETKQIRVRIAEISQFFGIQNWFHKETQTLSGGQKQILNLAAVMAMQPEILILDEPTSQLDPIAAREFLSSIRRINQELGTTILIAEHNLEEILRNANKLWVMDKGNLMIQGAPEKVGRQLKNMGHPIFLNMPIPFKLYAQMEVDENHVPLTIGEGRKWLETYIKKQDVLERKEIETRQEVAKEINYEIEKKIEGKIEAEESVLQAENIWFRYDKQSEDILKGISLRVKRGEIYSILGGNGTGKTTLLSLLSGMNQPQRGKLIRNGKVVILPQNPQLLFTRNTVQAELEEGISGQNSEEMCIKLEKLIWLCGLKKLLHKHPYDLSVGEQQRVALVKVLILEPDILLLDEPTKGLDIFFKIRLGELLENLSQQGKTIVMVSHDIEFCALYSKQCALLFDGQIMSQSQPKTFFSGNHFYTTAVSRMTHEIFPDAIIEEDVLSFFDKRINRFKENWSEDQEDWKQDEQIEAQNQNENELIEEEISKRLAIKKSRTAKNQKLIFLSLLLILLTLAMGIYLLDDRKYYFVSLLILLEIFIPFMYHYEMKKPETREIVLVAVLCTLGIVGRMAFFMLPQFKPVAALIILVGISLGSELGFLIGALIAFTSNFFFGQGPWTPWQMFAFGSIGLMAGILFKSHHKIPSKKKMCLFGFIVTFCIYGGIMNPASVLMIQNHPTMAMILLAYTQGIPFDLIHAISTVIFLLLFGEAFLEKMERIKIKYQLKC